MFFQVIPLPLITTSLEACALGCREVSAFFLWLLLLFSEGSLFPHIEALLMQHAFMPQTNFEEVYFFPLSTLLCLISVFEPLDCEKCKKLSSGTSFTSYDVSLS